MDKKLLYQKLIDRLGGPTKAARALGVDQSTASGWTLGRHGMGGAVAIKAEELTGGEFKAIQLVLNKNRERGPSPRRNTSAEAPA